MSCGEDGTVRWFDLRVKSRCALPNCRDDVIVNSRRAVSAIAVNNMRPWQLAVGSADGFVTLYDRRMLSTHTSGL